MSIECERLERGVYRTRVRGDVSLSELAAAQDQLFALWRAAEDPPVIAILDLREMPSAPDADLNSEGVRALVRRQFEAVRAYVVLGAPQRARALMPAVAALLRVRVFEAENNEDALLIARRLLDDHHQSGGV